MSRRIEVLCDQDRFDTRCHTHNGLRELAREWNTYHDTDG